MLLFAGESHELGKHEDQCVNTMLDFYIILGETANVPTEVMAIIERRPRTAICCACAAYGLPCECYWRRMLEMCAYACLLFF